MKYTKQEVIDKINLDRKNTTIEYDIDNPQLLKEIYQGLDINKKHDIIGEYYYYFFLWDSVCANYKNGGTGLRNKVIKLSEIIGEVNYEIY
jgi:hypothetical protein